MVDGELVALRAMVRGRVQGVDFRQFVYTRGRFLGLSGYVANLPDGGTVEVVAEGPKGDLDQLLEYLHEGPRSARVDAVEVTWSEITGQYRDFRILP